MSASSARETAVLASVNKLWLTPRLVRNETNAAAGLRRSIFLELTLVVGIVVGIDEAHASFQRLAGAALLTGEVGRGSCPVQIIFCLKEQNKKKLNSHR